MHWASWIINKVSSDSLRCRDHSLAVQHDRGGGLGPSRRKYTLSVKGLVGRLLIPCLNKVVTLGRTLLRCLHSLGCHSLQIVQRHFNHLALRGERLLKLWVSLELSVTLLLNRSVLLR